MSLEDKDHGSAVALPWRMRAAEEWAKAGGAASATVELEVVLPATVTGTLMLLKLDPPLTTLVLVHVTV